MKKLLLGSAAAVALTATGAAAQEWSATLNGFFTGAFAYIDANQTGNDFGLLRDSEVHFNFKLVADNGLTFGTRTEMEASDGSIDENFMFVEGAFGRVELGEADGAADGPMGSGNVGSDFVRAGDNTGLLFDYYEGDSNVNIRSNGADTSDAIKLSYFTPSFAGFTAGVSWVPALAAENTIVTPLDSANEQNAFELGAQYKGEFAGFGVTVGGGYVTDTVVGADDDSSWAGGAKVSWIGFEVGANYGYIDFDESSHLGVGVAYKTGPWKFGADYGLVISVDEPGNSPANRDEDDTGFAGGVSYALAPGVVTGATLEYADDGAAGGDDSIAAGLWLSLGY
jgi:predicted porin